MIKIDGYPIDLAETEQYQRESEASKSPVEKGADITDHVRTGPRELTFEGIVSDTPIGAIATDVTRTNLGEKTRPSQDAFQRLEALQDTPRFVSIDCSLGHFESMLLTSLSVPRDAKTTKGLKFTVVFEQINVRSNQRTTVRMSIPNGPGKVTIGNKESQEWGASLGIKDAIFVVSVRTDLSETWAKSFGPPLHRRRGAVEYDCFQVLGETQPDGFLTVNNSKVSTDKYTYHPMSDLSEMGGTPTSNARGVANGSETKVGTFIGDRPVHYDYADGTWKDDRDNSVVRTVPTKAGQPGFNEDKWRGVTVVDPKGHRQSY